MSSSIPVILVTGASRGLGRGVAIHLASKGYSVAINYAGNKAAADETAKLCRDAAILDNQEFLPVQADISKTEDRNRMVETVISEMGRIDALVNNAGIAPRIRADITGTDEESFDEVMKVNLYGPYFLTQRVANYWLEQKPEPLLLGGFKIVIVSSISATTASINRGEYCISKAGLAMVTKLWAVRLAAENISVIELRPGIMQTDMTSGVKGKYDALIEEGLVPQKRWGLPEDVAKGVESIVAGHFPFSTGDVIYIDGGFNISRL